VISDLVDRKTRITTDTVQGIAHRYLHGLLSGKKIKIVDNQGEKSISHNLTLSLATQGLRRSQVINGNVKGKKFSVVHATLKEYDPTLSGIHFGFGYRFIKKEKSLDHTVALPGNLYAEVILSSDWKSSLGPNKTDIVRHYSELCSAVYNLLKDQIKKLETQAESIKIANVNLKLKNFFADLVINPLKPGDHRKVVDIDVERNLRGKRKKKGGMAKPNPGTGSEVNERKARSGGVSFKFEEEAMNCASRHALVRGSLTIYLNKKIDLINHAYAKEKVVGLWPIVAQEFSNFVREQAEKVDDILPGFIDALNKQKYKVDPTESDSLAKKVYAYIMNQAPLSKAERAAISRLVKEDVAAEQ